MKPISEAQLQFCILYFKILNFLSAHPVPLPDKNSHHNPMQSELSCPLCNFQFSEDKTPRIISMCGHTFCQECIQTMIMPNEDQFRIICPQDEVCSDLTTKQIKQFPINKVLLKIIESNKSKSSFKDSSFDVSKIVKHEELQEDEQTKELISAIQQSQQEESEFQAQKSQLPNPTQANNSTTYTDVKKEDLKKQEQQQEDEEEEEDENICLLHQKPLEVVCIVDLEKICAKCALFGKHKGHDFKSLQQIEQENNAFYQQLLAVYDEKTVVLNRVENKQTKPDLQAILTVNKQNLTKQIKQRYKKLVDAIRVQEKKALSKLEKFAQKIEKDIDELYNIEPTLIEKYEEWQRLSFEKLQTIEKGTFEEKLQLLIIQQANSEKNIIVQGNALVKKIKNQQNDILSKAEVFLTNMNMKSNDKIFEFIETYVEVYDKLSEAPKEQPVVPSSKEKINNYLIHYSGKKHSEDDLLDIGENEDRAREDLAIYQMEFQPPAYSGGSRSAKKQEPFRFDESKFVPTLQSNIFQEKPQKPVIKHEVRPETKRSSEAFTVEELKKKIQTVAPQSNFVNPKHQDSFSIQKIIRPTKKKLKTIKVPEKYEKVLDGLYADNSQTFDLTNAELGDTVILQICEFIPGTKLKTIKFIRNKLTDDCVLKMLPYLGNLITLNLSQNLLTERVLDIFIDNRELLPKVKNIILSLNKIIERKHKNKIDELRKFDITVSV